MAWLMKGALQMSDLKTLPDSLNVTSSLALVDGHMHCVLQVSPMITRAGQDHHRASPSVSQESNSDNSTIATLPPHSCGSLSSANLQSSLANKLRQRLENTGSMIYSLSWKDKATPAGRQYCQRAASVPRTKGIDFSLGQLIDWPTPAVSAITNGVRMQSCKDGRKKPNKVGWAAALCSWPTPTANNGTGPGTSGRQGGMNLQTAASMAAWPTPTTIDNPQVRGEGKAVGTSRGTTLGGAVRLIDKPIRILAITGQTLIGSAAGMDILGQLNPAHSRWLMGFPPEWDACAVTAMPSSRK
ncbi:restriction enzyme [Tatumella ptyseos ATCC 33301]|uniref:Restriction enzyme n=1 Tax=Tatumella ptyseos ATCC 33301 TaxID=1005995 RepID=A0A085JGT3_9GAMM|nr:restriction enzyme [Tatumella ptyseos ATCC 33301]